MARRTKAEIRAAKIAELARKKRELDDLMRAEQREAAKEVKAALVASQVAFGKAVGSMVGANSSEDMDRVLEAMESDGTLDRMAALLTALREPEAGEEEAGTEPAEDVSEVDQPEPDGDGESGPGDVPEAVDPSDDEPTPGYRPWGA